MNAFGHTELTVNELPDRLQFRVDREAGWAPAAVLLIVSTGFMIFSLTISVPTLRYTFAAVTAGFFVWIGITLVRNLKKIDTTTLSVTSESLVATGAGLRWLGSGNSTSCVPTAEIRSMGYETGGEDDPSGLYVSCGFWKNRCLLPGLNRQQCTAVTIAIVRRFPEIGSKIQRKK
jgi:hypothetical protein